MKAIKQARVLSGGQDKFRIEYVAESVGNSNLCYMTQSLSNSRKQKHETNLLFFCTCKRLLSLMKNILSLLSLNSTNQKVRGSKWYAMQSSGP